MELDALISEICDKVRERVVALESQDGRNPSRDSEEQKPRLLLLTQEHGTICHPILECKKLGEYYQVDCALLLEGKYDPAEYEGVIACTLTNDALSKIANGILDTDYTRAFGTALLLGKKIFVAEEEVELYRYKETAPAGYYARLEENLKFLEKNGVTIVPVKELAPAVLGEQVGEKKTACKAQTPAEHTIRLEKRVITERDLISAKEEKATRVLVKEHAILTDLAKDYARRHKIVLERTEKGD